MTDQETSASAMTTQAWAKTLGNRPRSGGSANGTTVSTKKPPWWLSSPWSSPGTAAAGAPTASTHCRRPMPGRASGRASGRVCGRPASAPMTAPSPVANTV